MAGFDTFRLAFFAPGGAFHNRGEALMLGV
jgi:hypothetical protein